ALESSAASPLLWLLLMSRMAGVTGGGMIFSVAYSGAACGRMFADFRDSWSDSSHPNPTPNVAREMTRRTPLPRFAMGHPFFRNAMSDAVSKIPPNYEVQRPHADLSARGRASAGTERQRSAARGRALYVSRFAATPS